MLRKGTTGAEVATLQKRLIEAGLLHSADGWFGEATEAAVIALQRRAGLVADGIAGPKTIEALVLRERPTHRLSEADLQRAADRLGVQLAAIKAVNEIESRGTGFLPDGRPVILYERHKAFSLLGETGMPYAEAIALAERYPNILGEKRGGYAGGTAEWGRLKTALQIVPADVAHSACSWGQYQIMGYHWQTLGYENCDAFVTDMHLSEGRQLEAFCRFLEADPAIHKALKARKWADFAAHYNGPAYRENSYDTRLAAAYARYQRLESAA